MKRERMVGLIQDSELRRRVLLTIGILIVYRLLVHIPVMEFDRARLGALMREDQYVFAWDMQSGGALATLSVLALGMAPHFGAQAMLYGLTQFSRSLQEAARHSPDKYKRYQYWLAIPVGLLQIILLFGYLQREGALTRFSVDSAGLLYLATKVAMLIAGSFFVSWLADRITEDGIGSGFPVLVFGGVAARLPALMADLFDAGVVPVVLVMAALIATLYISIMINEGQRRVPVQYPTPRRSRPLKYGTGASIPIRVNRVGTGPLETSLALIATLAFVAIPLADLGGPSVAGPASRVVGLLKGTSGFWILYVLGTLSYALIAQDVAFDGQAIARTLDQQGGIIPGVRRGEATARYLERVSNRVSPVGIIYLGVMAILPYALGMASGVQSVVSDAALATLLGFDTVLDALGQIKAFVMMRSYWYVGFIK